MYLGNMVEVAESHELYGSSRHPYTKALFSAIPNPDPFAEKERIILEGDIPSPMNLQVDVIFTRDVGMQQMNVKCLIRRSLLNRARITLDVITLLTS